MTVAEISSSGKGIGVSLVDGDPDVRHARQIMLRSEMYDVRSYATSSALLADLGSRNYACIILDLVSHDVDALTLLKQMRATGWRGRAILLNGDDPGGSSRADVERYGDKVYARGIGDQSLMAAILASVAPEVERLEGQVGAHASPQPLTQRVSNP